MKVKTRFAICVFVACCAISGTAIGDVTYRITDLGPNPVFDYDGPWPPPEMLQGYTEARAANSKGHITGSTTFGSVSHAFLYDGSMHDLGTLGGIYSEGDGINDNDWVTGQSGTAVPGMSHAFLYDGAIHDLGTLGGSESAGAAINSSGLIAGYSYIENDAGIHAFLYDGTMHDLGTFGGRTSLARSINANGDVTGMAFLPGDSTYHAFIFNSSSGLIDLNSLIDPGSGWMLLDAVAINDAGQIKGYGAFGNESHGFLLTPVPEPGTLLLVVTLIPLFPCNRRLPLSN